MPKIADNCRLSRKQERAILELLNPINRTLIEVAKKIGISERTLRYWQNLPHFQRRLEQERKKLLRQGIDNLGATFNLAVRILRKLMFSDDPSISYKASQALIGFNLRLLEREKEKKPRHPYDDLIDGEGEETVKSIYERLNNLKAIQKGNIERMKSKYAQEEKEKAQTKTSE